MINIGKRAFKNYIRNKRNLIIMIFFPIILMTVLGGILKGDFSNQNIKKSIVYYYANNPSKENSEILKVLDNFKGNSNIEFKATNSLDSGKAMVKNNKDSFIYINGNDIEIFNSIEKPIEKAIVDGVVNSVVKRFNAIDEAMKVNPVITMENLKSNDIKQSVKIEKLPAAKAPSSFDYYAITDITLFALYMAITPLAAIDYDERKGIKNRIKLAGIGELEYQLGNTIGYFFVSIVVTIPAYLYSMYVLKVNWGNPIITYGSILILSTASILLGQVICSFARNSGKAIGLLKAVIFPILAFLGGAYTPIYSGVNSISKIFNYLTEISPLRWINKGIMDYIYQGTYRNLLISTGLDVAFIILFIFMLVIISKRRER